MAIRDRMVALEAKWSERPVKGQNPDKRPYGSKKSIKDAKSSMKGARTWKDAAAKEKDPEMKSFYQKKLKGSVAMAKGFMSTSRDRAEKEKGRGAKAAATRKKNKQDAARRAKSDAEHADNKRRKDLESKRSNFDVKKTPHGKDAINFLKRRTAKNPGRAKKLGTMLKKAPHKRKQAFIALAATREQRSKARDALRADHRKAMASYAKRK